MMASTANRIVATSKRCCTLYRSARKLASSAAASSSSSAAAGAAASSPESQILPSSSHGLGLENHWIRPYWESIRQLPEIPRALSVFDSSLASDNKDARSHDPLDDLSRAENVFRSLSEGGGEHRATLALLAELQQLSGSYPACHHTLQRLQSYNAADDDASNGSREHVSLSLARAKTLWYLGDAQATASVCDDVLELDNGPVGLNALQQASARTGQAMGYLLKSTETLDDVFSIRDPFRMVVKSLERALPASLPLALAHLNYGVAEAYYGHVIEQQNGVVAPIDAALRSWKQGLTIVQRSTSPSTSSTSTSSSLDPAVTRALEARLLGNMAWGLLKAGNVEQASEYAGQALQLYDRLDDVVWSKEGMGRALALVATCYHKSGSAVTSEGLFQSAIDDSRWRAWARSSPLYQLELADSYSRFADLCREWDKREGDTKRLEDQARQVRSALPSAWQAKPSICASLWFWTPSMR